MKLTVIILCLFIVQLTTSTTEKCDNHEGCYSTDYQSYVECVRKRHKRSISCQPACNSGNCIDVCSDCDCNSCNYSNCQTTCNTCCSSCCSNYIPCNTNHCCHKTCHSQCDSTKCRSSCRKNCFETIKQSTNETKEAFGQNQSSSIKNENKYNVTTIIHLNNVINNTNVIDVPIILNNTNEQNITLYSADIKGSNNKPEQKCCTVIGPRQCVSYPKRRCFHYRSKQCGPYCTASIVHKEQQQVCESFYPGAPPNCRQQIMYIPQPQPRCVYQSTWPYVSCGIQPPVTCNGCYSHYANQASTNHLSCSSQCYDDGFGIGPMFRQGPYYRPMYSHAPCYECFGYGNPYTGYGYNAYGGPGYGIYGGYGGGLPYPPQNDRFPPFFAPSSIQTNENMSLNEIPPNDIILSQNFNEIPSFDPQFSVGSGLLLPYPPQDPYREIRDVEIEVNHEPSSKAQAEVTIKKKESSENKINEYAVNSSVAENFKHISTTPASAVKES